MQVLDPAFWTRPRRAIVICLVLGAICVLLGMRLVSGPPWEPRPLPDQMGGTTQEERDKIKGYLQAAGINGDIVVITQDDVNWYVQVVPTPPKDGSKRGMPPRAIPYRIAKSTGKVAGGPSIPK